jgi:hypothetical protein
MLARMTSKNQLTLPKKLVQQFPGARFFDATAEEGCIRLTPLRLQRADEVRAKLRQLGLTEGDVREAVSWARRRA